MDKKMLQNTFKEFKKATVKAGVGVDFAISSPASFDSSTVFSNIVDKYGYDYKGICRDRQLSYRFHRLSKTLHKFLLSYAYRHGCFSCPAIFYYSLILIIISFIFIIFCIFIYSPEFSAISTYPHQEKIRGFHPINHESSALFQHR